MMEAMLLPRHQRLVTMLPQQPVQQPAKPQVVAVVAVVAGTGEASKEAPGNSLHKVMGLWLGKRGVNIQGVKSVESGLFCVYHCRVSNVMT